MESLESGAREKRWNTARRHARLCSFSFSGRMTGHPAKKKEKRERETLARDGAAARVELDAEEAPSGELGCERPEPPDDR
jgi:hypothetical protein